MTSRNPNKDSKNNPSKAGFKAVFHTAAKTANFIFKGIKQTMNDKTALNKLFYRLAENSFSVIEADGEKINTYKAALDLALNLDECIVRVRKDGFASRGILLVMGNSGDEIVADYSVAALDPDGFMEVMEKVQAEFDAAYLTAADRIG